MEDRTEILEQRIAELEEQLSLLQAEKKRYLLDKAVIALMTKTDNARLGERSFTRISGIQFHGNRFVICGFVDNFSEPGTMDESPIWESLNSSFYYVLSDLICPQFRSQCACVTANYNGCILCLVNLSDSLSLEDYQSAFLKMCTDVNDAVEKAEGFRFQIFVSPIGFGLSQLPELRSDVETLVEYWKMIGGGLPEVLFYRSEFQEPPEKQKMITSRETNEQFSDYIDRGDFDLAKKFFHETIVRDMLEMSTSVNVLRFRIAALIDYMTQTLTRASYELGIADVLDEMNAFELLLSAQNLDEMISQVDRLLDAMDQKWKTVGSASQVLAQNARRYIDENFTDSELNVNLVADQMGVTASHLTRTFHNVYQTGVHEYIQLVRLRAAKSLLSTDLTLKEIAEKSGYGAQINMIRAFKRQEGKTPREFGKKEENSV